MDFPFLKRRSNYFLEYLKVAVAVFVDFVLEVTVTVTTQTGPTGVLVIVKLVFAEVDDFVSVKKFVDDPSGAAFTSMVTPCGGIVDVTVTVIGKSVCGAGGWVVFAGGFVVIVKFASGVSVPPPPLFEQSVIPKIMAATITRLNKIFFIKVILD